MLYRLKDTIKEQYADRRFIRDICVPIKGTGVPSGYWVVMKVITPPGIVLFLTERKLNVVSDAWEVYETIDKEVWTDHELRIVDTNMVKVYHIPKVVRSEVEFLIHNIRASTQDYEVTWEFLYVPQSIYDKLERETQIEEEIKRLFMEEWQKLTTDEKRRLIRENPSIVSLVLR
jgi:hypothetical protein